MRWFTAIELPTDVRLKIAEAQGRLRRAMEAAGSAKASTKISPRISWTKPANFHVTLKFLGDVADDQTSHVIEALSAVASPQFLISISRLGALPPRGRARVLTAELAGEVDRLAAL